MICSQSIDRYENLGLVGRGAFNKIYKARNRESGEVVALKSMQLAALEQAGQVQGDEGIPLEMMREMSILLSMRHPNIVTVHEVVMDPTQMFLVMELVAFDLGLLIEHMKQPFSEAQVSNVRNTIVLSSWRVGIILPQACHAGCHALSNRASLVGVA